MSVDNLIVDVDEGTTTAYGEDLRSVVRKRMEEMHVEHAVAAKLIGNHMKPLSPLSG